MADDAQIETARQIVAAFANKPLREREERIAYLRALQVLAESLKKSDEKQPKSKGPIQCV